MSTLNPQTASDWGSFSAGVVAVLATIWAIFTWPFKTFITIKSAERNYVKKVEADGSRNYVHPTDIVEMKEDIKSIKEIVERWR